MKNSVKKLTAILIAALMLLSVFALSACKTKGDQGSTDTSATTTSVSTTTNTSAEDNTPAPTKAELTGVYSTGNFSFFSAYPGYTFKRVTTSVQSVKTYSDNTYELTVTDKSISGSLAFDPEDNGNTDTSTSNDRGQTVTIYYGNFTSSSEEGILTLDLATPTIVMSLITGNSTSGTSYYNTAAWTSEMATASEKASAAEYLASVAFKPATLIVDESTNNFDYVALEKLAEGASVTPATKDDIIGAYGSGTFTFFSAYPAYTFKRVTTITQTIVTHKDGTYELTVTSKDISGALAFDPEDNGNQDVSTSNDRGQTVTVYTGTFTSGEEEGLLTLSLSKPTAVISLVTGNSTSGACYYNTAAWTNEMSTASEKSASEYLASVAFAPIEIIVDLSINGFDYTVLTVA